MSSRIVDARSLLCPQPLILTNKALKDFLPGDSLTVLVDNETAKENVTRYLLDQGVKPTVTQSGSDFEIVVGEVVKRVDEKKSATEDHLIVFSNNSFGQGPTELSQLLIQGFCNTIKNVSPLPTAMIFYTNGVKLLIEGSPLVESFKELEKLGVKLLVCGTCLDYFKVKEQLKVGQVSNMLTILEALTNASKVIYP